MSVANLIPRERRAWINLSLGPLISLHGPGRKYAFLKRIIFFFDAKG
jgi:hypothetical protein